jgi:excisionase family DNA binding protein
MYKSTEVAEILGVCRRTVNNLVRRGELTPSVKTSKIHLFTQEEVEKYKSKIQ